MTDSTISAKATAATSLPPFTVSSEYQAQLNKEKLLEGAANAITEAVSAATGPKPGILTSEFWLHILALLVPILYNYLTQSDNTAVVAGAQAAASVYTLARTLHKNQVVKSTTPGGS